MNISDQAFAALYEDLEEAFEAARFLGEFRRAMEYASMMRALEQANLVPHNVEVDEDDDGETMH